MRHPDAEARCRKLPASGVVPEVRTPARIRVGFSPLTTRFPDVWDGVVRLQEFAAG